LASLEDEMDVPHPLDVPLIHTQPLLPTPHTAPCTDLAIQQLLNSQKLKENPSISEDQHTTHRSIPTSSTLQPTIQPPSDPPSITTSPPSSSNSVYNRKTNDSIMKDELEPGDVPDVIEIKEEVKEESVIMVTNDSPLVTMVTNDHPLVTNDLPLVTNGPPLVTNDSFLSPSLQQLVSSLSNQSKLNNVSSQHHSNNVSNVPSVSLITDNSMLASSTAMFGLNKSDRISIPFLPGTDSNLLANTTLPNTAGTSRAEPNSTSRLICKYCGREFSGKAPWVRLRNLERHVHTAHAKRIKYN